MILSDVPSHCTVEPINNGHVGTRRFVVCREVVLASEVQNVVAKLLTVIFIRLTLIEKQPHT